jgi:hypothetical protein
MIRKIVTYFEETLEDGGRAVQPSTRIAVVAAVIKNPFADRFEEDISALRTEFSERLARTLVPRALAVIAHGLENDVDVKCFGKAALVGTEGEIEHGSMLIHNMDFGGTFRDLIGGGDAMIPSAEKRGGPGATLDIPLKNRHDASLAAYHQTIEFRIPDAPAPDEIVVAAGISLSTRPHPRIGTRE